VNEQHPFPPISIEELHLEIKKEYTNVALDPNKGYHFHTGRRLAILPGYTESLYADLPESNIASFAGTGNPFSEWAQLMLNSGWGWLNRCPCRNALPTW